MESTWLQLAQQAVTSIAGVIITGLGVIVGIYMKKANTSLQRKNLVDMITRYVKWAEQSPTFKKYSGEEKYVAVEDKARQWCMTNNVSLTDDELMIYIESSVKNMKLEEGLSIVKPEKIENPQSDSSGIIEDEAKG